MLRDEFEMYKLEQNQRFERIEHVIESNTVAVERLANAVEAQANSTAGIVQLYSDLQGAARLGNGLQRFMGRLAALGTAGAALAAAVLYVIDKFSTPGIQ